jgi:hypothetical protein
VPYAGWTVWGYLADSTQVKQIGVRRTCSPETDIHCTGYALTGFSSLVITNPDKRQQGKNVETAVILYNVPSYIVEF